MNKEKEGVWRTIRGRRIFIASGESLGQAMSKSGKFNNQMSRVKKNKDKYDIIQKAKNFDKDLKKTNRERYDIDKSHEKDKWEEQEKYKARHNTKEAQRYEKNEYKKMQDFKAKKQSNNKYEKQYDSVVDRYNKDEKFRDTLKKEHDKTIEATRKEIKSFLQGKKYFEKNGIENEDDLYNQINDNYYNVSREDFDKIYKEEYDKNAQEAYETRQREGLDKFIQNTNMYGGTREYSKEDLDRMAEQGIRPMKNSYTGGGWEGVNSRQNLSTSEQAKAITVEMKKQFPDVKIARRSDVYSGGSSIDFNIMSSDKDLYISEKDIDKLSNEQIHNMLNDYNNGLTPYFDRWAEQNVSSYKNEHTYTIDDVKRYMKEDIKNLKSRENQNVSGNEYYLSDYGKKVVSALNKEANSYTFDDSDGQIDYFHHGTYMDISIGKWNKPYQVNESKKIKDYVSKKKSNHE